MLWMLVHALQRYDKELSVWINDGYEIERVWQHIPAGSVGPESLAPIVSISSCAYAQVSAPTA